MDGNGTTPVALNRAHTTVPDWFAHDMAPKDPYKADVAPRPRSGGGASSYEPSTGAPSRADHRYRGYTNNQMLAERTKTSMSMDGPLPAYHRSHVADLYREQPPRHPVTRSDEFLAEGKATSQYERQHPGGINALHSAPEAYSAAKAEQRMKQQEFVTHLNERERAKAEARAQKRAEQQRDLAMLQSYDPFSKPAGRGNTRYVSGERLYRELEKQSPAGYVDQVMGKQGSGAPRRTSSGKLMAKMTLDQETQMSNVYKDNLGPASEVKYGVRDGRAEYKAELDRQAAERQQTLMEQRMRESSEVEQPSPFAREDSMPTAPRDARRKAALRENNSPTKSSNQRRQYGQDLAAQQQELEARREAERQERLEKHADFAPWGRGVGAPVRDATGRVIGHKRIDPHGEVPTQYDVTMARESSLVDQLGRKTGGGAPVETADGRIQTKTKMIVKEPERVRPQQGEPWGKSGAGAPIRSPSGKLHTKVAGTTFNDVTGVSEYRKTHDIQAKKMQYAKEQQEFMLARQASLSSMKGAGGEVAVDEYFKFGKGAGAPKRDAEGNLARNARQTADVTAMKLDKGGGRGRRQKTENSHELARELTMQQEQKQQREVSWRKAEKALENTHVTYAGRQFGQDTIPRLENGEPTGRLMRDPILHHNEMADNVRAKPKGERLKYGSDLDKIRSQKAAEREQLVREDTLSTQNHLQNAHRGYGRAGAGAPLRSKSGRSKEPRTGRLRERGDEYRLNAKAGRKLE